VVDRVGLSDMGCVGGMADAVNWLAEPGKAAVGCVFFSDRPCLGVGLAAQQVWVLLVHRPPSLSLYSGIPQQPAGCSGMPTGILSPVGFTSPWGDGGPLARPLRLL